MPYWVQLVIFVVISGLIQYLIVYFKEKGKNLATKEDIGEITKEIKSIESNFINETEKLKAELNLLTNIEIGLISEKRNVIAELHASLQKWMYAIIHLDMNCYDNNNICYNSIEKINNLYNDVLTKEAVFKIYIEDENLRSYIYDINKNGIKCMDLTIKLLSFMIHSNDDLAQQKVNNNYEETRVLHQKRKEALEKFLVEQTEASKALLNIIGKFEDQCRKYITEFPAL